MMKLILLLLPLLLVAAVPGSCATIYVVEDESVTGGDAADTNWDNWEYRGGLWSGCDGGTSDSPARFYLKFNMPSYEPGTYIESAMLHGYYNDDWSDADDGLHDIYLSASDAWSQSTITWNNQPGTSGSPIAGWDAKGETTGTWQNWDIAATMDAEYQGDGVLSLVFRARDETVTRNNWEYFAGREYDPNLAFFITYRVIPEPGIVSLFGVALGAAAIGLRRIRR